MIKKLYFIFAGLIIAALILAACGPAAEKAPDCSTAEDFCVGLVTDVGKIDDKSFNQSKWQAVKSAEANLGAHVQYIETVDSKDYDKNIATFADEKYDVIVTVGFALGEATVAAAKKYPDVKFIGVDQFQAEVTPNVAGLIFPEDNAGFLVLFLGPLNQDRGKGDLSPLDPFGLLFPEEGNFRRSAVIWVLSLASENGKREGDRHQQTEAQNPND